MRKPSRLEPSRLRPTALRAILALGGLLAALGLIEVGVRIFASESRDEALPRGLVSSDALLGWRLHESRKALHRSPYFEAEYATNGLGYRDPPRSIESTDLDRVLLYGDSQIFGWGVPAAARFSNLVEAASDRLEIWNLAVPGYGVDQEVLSYQRDSAAWHADAVILFISGYTESRLHHNYMFGYHKPEFLLDATRGVEVIRPHGYAPRRLLFSLPEWMYTPYFLDRELTRADQRWRQHRPLTDSDELLEVVLGFAAGISRERGEKLFVLSSISGEEKTALEALCVELGIGFLTVGLPAEPAPWVWGPYDEHWNLDANRRIAESLGEQLASLD